MLMKLTIDWLKNNCLTSFNKVQSKFPLYNDLSTNNVTLQLSQNWIFTSKRSNFKFLNRVMLEKLTSKSRASYVFKIMGSLRNHLSFSNLIINRFSVRGSRGKCVQKIAIKRLKTLFCFTSHAKYYCLQLFFPAAKI